MINRGSVYIFLKSGKLHDTNKMTEFHVDLNEIIQIIPKEDNVSKIDSMYEQVMAIFAKLFSLSMLSVALEGRIQIVAHVPILFIPQSVNISSCRNRGHSVVQTL